MDSKVIRDKAPQFIAALEASPQVQNIDWSKFHEDVELDARLLLAARDMYRDKILPQAVKDAKFEEIREGLSTLTKEESIERSMWFMLKTTLDYQMRVRNRVIELNAEAHQ